jgi:hypothetical protein
MLRNAGSVRPLGSRLPITSWVAGSGRLAAASVPTGPELGEEQNWVAWLGEQRYFSRYD